MYYNTPYYTAGCGGVPIVSYFQTPETRDQFIRRYIKDRVMETSGYNPVFIDEARLIWDASVQKEGK